MCSHNHRLPSVRTRSRYPLSSRSPSRPTLVVMIARCVRRVQRRGTRRARAEDSDALARVAWLLGGIGFLLRLGAFVRLGKRT